MLARSAPQILFIKGECTFLFWDFLMTGLRNSSANFLFEIFSFLTVTLEVFYQKIYKPLKQYLFYIHQIRIFSNIKCFIMQNILSESVLLAKFLKSTLAMSC